MREPRGRRVDRPVMMSSALQDVPPFAGHSPDQERPLGGYTALTGLSLGVCGAFAAWFRASGRVLPTRVRRAIWP